MSLQLAYYDPFSVFPLIKPSLDTKLPLTNLHWKFHESSPLKSIPKLPIDLVEEVPKKINESAHVRLMFIQSTTLDVYKSQVRPLIKEWLKHSVKEGVEWQIVMYSPMKKDKYSFKTSVFEKLKVDFGKEGKELSPLNIRSGGVERCFRLKETNDNELNKLEMYNMFVNTIKELILASFIKNFQSIDKKLQDSPKKDLIFMNLLLKKATYFQDLYLFKDSLKALNELTSYLQIYYHNNQSSFEKIMPVIDYHNIEKVFVPVDLLKESNYFKVVSFIYHRKFKLLLNLIENERLYSIKSLHVSNLFQEVIQYINTVSSLFGTSSLHFGYHLINYFLHQTAIESLIKTPVLDDMDASNLEESLGELKLFQRSILIKVGNIMGYHIFEFEEISLDNEEENLELELQGDLVSIMESKDTYFNFFEKLTETVIQHFVTCSRTKTIDVLSIDLAFLNYHKANYKESLNILQDSYLFFIEHGWNYMGGLLLEIYIDCIEKLNINNVNLLVSSYIKLFSNLKSITKKVDSNNYRITKSPKQISTLLNKIVQSSAKLLEKIEFPIEKVFEINLLQYIKVSDNQYYMDLEVSNLHGTEFDFASIELELTKGLTFLLSDVHFLKDLKQVVRLVSNRLVVGFFRPVGLLFVLTENLSFVYSFDQAVESQNSFLHDSVINQTPNINTDIDSNTIYFYPNEDVFNCKVSYTPKLWLGSPSILVQLKNGKHSVKDINISFLSAENFKFKQENLVVPKADLQPHERYLVEVPIQPDPDQKIVNVRILIKYCIEETTHEFIIEEQIDMNLEISVSVQDIFKPESFFSRFQVGSVISSPIRILSTGLATVNEATLDNYKISVPRVCPERSVVFGDQIYSSFYKIELKEGKRISATDGFKLSVEYSLVAKECQGIFMSLFSKDLQQFIPFFENLVLTRIKFDYQLYLLESKLSILNLNEVLEFIDKISKFIPLEERQVFKLEARNLLSTAHIVEDATSKSCVQSLNILVPVSNMDILQIVEFKFDQKDKYVVGEPIPVEFIVDSNIKWSSKLKSEESENTPDLSINAESSLLEEDANHEKYQITILNDDSWLISGFRKKIFLIDLTKNSNINKLNLVLTPLAVGKLGLPKFSIKLLNNKELSMDISNNSGCKNLVVVPELDKITFSF